MQQRTFIILVSIIIILSLVAIGIFYLTDPTIRKPSVISGVPSVKKDLSIFYPLGGERVDQANSGTYRFFASSTKLVESVVDFSGRTFKDYLKLVRLVETPVAGAAFIGSGSSSRLYFIDAQSGEVNVVDFQNKATRVVAKTEQKNINNVVWGEDGTSLSLIARFVRNDNPVIYTASMPIASGKSPLSLKGSIIGRDVRAMTASPRKQNIFYLEADSDGYVVGNIANPGFTNPKEIYTSPLAEWKLSWPETNTIGLQTKAAGSVPGFLYILNPTTKELKKIIGNTPGLTTLISPNGKLVLMSESNDINYVSSLFNVGNNSKTGLSLRALPDKCVWNKDSTVIYCAVPSVVPAGQYPDAWYQGEVKFNDSLWQINISDSKTTLLNSPSESLINEEMDATNLFLDPTGTKLLFTNKRDQSLWMLDLENNY